MFWWLCTIALAITPPPGWSEDIAGSGAAVYIHDAGDAWVVAVDLRRATVTSFVDVADDGVSVDLHTAGEVAEVFFDEDPFAIVNGAFTDKDDPARLAFSLRTGAGTFLGYGASSELRAQQLALTWGPGGLARVGPPPDEVRLFDPTEPPELVVGLDPSVDKHADVPLRRTMVTVADPAYGHFQTMLFLVAEAATQPEAVGLLRSWSDATVVMFAGASATQLWADGDDVVEGFGPVGHHFVVTDSVASPEEPPRRWGCDSGGQNFATGPTLAVLVGLRRMFRSSRRAAALGG